MKTTTKTSIAKGESGVPGNSYPIHKIMLTVTIEGTPPMSKRIGEFEDGYESIAKEFCEWLNTKFSTTTPPGGEGAGR